MIQSYAFLLRDCEVRDFYLRLNCNWIKAESGRNPAEGAGLHRHLRWVASSGYTNNTWFKPVFLSFRDRVISSEERSLLWQVMHSDGRFGYRIRAEIRALRMEPRMGLANDGAAQTDYSRGVTYCPCCAPGGNNPAEDPG
jgi:hypothetical protein